MDRFEHVNLLYLLMEDDMVIVFQQLLLDLG